ncbi:MAG TPA: AI-2E family transporter [Candidatus Saccharimonadia bacterium]|nr:AI-2E family transporter [Candidatus Saccharimonadia bacterium]
MPAKPAKSETRQVQRPVPRSVQIAMAIAFLAAIWLVRPYFGAVIFSILIAFIFNPVYKAVLKKTGRNGLAIWSTLLVALLSFLLPLLLVIGVSVDQASSLADQFKEKNVSIGSAQIQKATDEGSERVTKLVQSLPGGENFKLDKQKVNEQLKKLAQSAVNGLINVVKNAGGAFIGLFTTGVLALMLITNLLSHQAEFMGFLKKLSPFHDDINNLYIQRAGSMTKAMVKGQFIIAVCQGLASTFSLWAAGLNYLGFFVIILIFLSFIPLGAGIITIPIGIVLALTGHVWQGIFLILFHLIVVTNIDNLLRPHLVPKDAKLNSAVTLLAVFSGIAIFGFPGIIYGPVLAIVLLTTFQMFAEYNEMVNRPRGAK